jgi:hypothetical protein
MALLTRDAILDAQDIKYEYVDVPEWGGTVRVRGMTGTERDQYDVESAMAARAGGSALSDFRVRRIARCIVDEDGNRIFTDKDIRTLGSKSGAVIDRVDDVAARLSGLTETSAKEATDALKASPSAGSGTD